MNKDPNLHRLHPLWIIISIGKTIKDFFIPIIFIFIINANSHSFLMKYGRIALIVYLIINIVLEIFHWKNFKYKFTDNQLQINEGRFIEKKRFIPLTNIQSIQLDEPFLQRIFGLASLTFSLSTTSDNASVQLGAITKEQAKRIQDHLNKIKNTIQTEQAITEETQILSKQKVHYEMSKREIIIAAFTSVGLLTAIPLILSLYFKLNQFLKLDQYRERLFSIFTNSSFLLIIGIATAILVFLCLSVGLMYLRYGKFQVASDDTNIFINNGILSKATLSIPINKIQAIEFEQNILRRLLGLTKVKLIIAGGISNSLLETAILFPFVKRERSYQLIQAEIIPKMKIKMPMLRIPKQALFIKMIRHSYLSLISIGSSLYFFPTYWYIAFIFVIIMILLSIMAFIHSKYLLNETYIQLYSGIFSTKLFVTTRERIEELKVTESWLQRKSGLASLHISTRANPIYNTKIKDIPKSVAIEYYQWYSKR